MNFRSIRFKLTVWYASLLSFLLILFGLIVYFGLQKYLTNSLSNQLSTQARQICGTWLNDIDTAGEDYVIDEIDEHLSPASTNRFIRLIRPNGTILFQSAPPEDQSFDPNQIPFPNKPYVTGIHKLDHLMMYSMTFTVNDDKYFVETAASYNDIRATLKTLAFLLAFIIPVGIILAIAGGFLLMKRALHPVDEITTAAQRITSQNLTERLPLPQSGDEIQRLSETLNEMIGRLENSFSRTIQFTADASHELRTPLTILRGELEVALRGNHINPEARTVIENVLEETERLSKTVESLMTLSRFDSGQVKLERSRFDLAVLCKETVELMLLLAEEKGIHLECDTPESLEIFADPIRVRQVVMNLIDNAIKFTPQHGTVRLTVSKHAGALIEVQDNGAGIPPEAVPHVFDRFYRVDKARSREQGGSGLGLAIVKSICDLHGASISMKSSSDTGTYVSVLFPFSTTQEKQVMKFISLFMFMILAQSIFASSEPKKIQFDDSPEGNVPKGFISALTGKGKPGNWKIFADPSAPSKPNVLAQTDGDTTSYRFPVCIVDEIVAQDVDVSVKFKAVTGKEDQAAGIVWRYKDQNNYYIARANALEGNVVMYKVQGGKRSDLKPQGAGMLSYGVKASVSSAQWSTLRITAKGNAFEVYLNGKKLFDVTDSTFPDAGKIGLWTKADSVTHFDDLEIKTLN